MACSRPSASSGRASPSSTPSRASIFAAGAALELLQDIGLIDDPGETAELAGRVDSTDGVYFVPAFQGLGAPHWDGRARGTIVGLTRGTERAHIVRAGLEAIAYRTHEVLAAMTADAGIDVTSLRVDGGAVTNGLLCQIQADIIGSEIIRPAVAETMARGAACAAGLAVGYWDSVDALRENWHVGAAFQARPDADGDYTRWAAAVERADDWAVDED